MEKKVIVIGGGFAGLSATQQLASQKGIFVYLIDRRNHHLFQPLLYQVAMAGLNPSEIAVPLRRLFSKHRNVKVLMSEVEEVNLEEKTISLDGNWMKFDYLVMACGSKHSYFGNTEWEDIAPGLKTIEQATEIRRRILLAFELAEKERDEKVKKKLQTFIVIGGGPTGVELAGAIAEMARHTLYKDFKSVDLKKTRVVLIEAGPRVLSAFPKKLSTRAKKDLESLGVEVILNQKASDLSKQGLKVDEKFLESQTIIWAAGVEPSKLTKEFDTEKSKDGRIIVKDDLSVAKFPSVFVLGDQAAFLSSENSEKKYLPALAPVAMQQGKFVGQLIKGEVKGKKRSSFKYSDKGIMATIGRSRAVVSSGRFQFTGVLAWLMWVLIHITYLVRFKNKFFVLLQWAWSYFRFGTGAHLIVHKTWKFYSGEKIPISRDD